MSNHSYSRCWLHLVWSTANKRAAFNDAAANRLSGFLHSYCERKDIYMKINFVNPDHVHCLIDLPTNLTIEGAIKLLKGSSSYWINQERLLADRFFWGRGYGAFSVSQSKTGVVSRYNANQKEHHRKTSFTEELREFVRRYGLDWTEEDFVSEEPADYGEFDLSGLENC